VVFWAPFGLLGGPGTAETGRLAPKTLPHSVPGWYASISCAWAPYETSTALLGPPKGPILAQKGPFGGPGQPRGPDLGPSATGWSNWVGRIHIMCSGPFRDHYGTPGAPKRAVLAQIGPFGGPGGPWAAPGGLIWAQVPLVGPTGWAASISNARAPYETTTALLGPPKGPVLAQKGPFGSPGGPWAALGGLIWAQLPLVGPTGWATWL